MKKKNPEAPKEECLLPFPDVEFYNKWQEWLLYRKQRRIAAYVAIGLNRTFDKLKADSGNDVKTAIAIIDQSIANNWQGLFPLRNTNTYGTGKKQPVSDDDLKNALLGAIKER